MPGWPLESKKGIRCQGRLVSRFHPRGLFLETRESQTPEESCPDRAPDLSQPPLAASFPVSTSRGVNLETKETQPFPS